MDSAHVITTSLLKELRVAMDLQHALPFIVQFFLSTNIVSLTFVVGYEMIFFTIFSTL
jgi:hypothetical protein